MDISKYLNSGFSCIFIETTEIKRAVNTIQVKPPFNKLTWNLIDNNGQFEILEESKNLRQHAIILENYDCFLENPAIQQTILNNYPVYKSNQVCLVIVGVNSKKIPPVLKELIPVLQFDLPSKEVIRVIVENLAKDAEEAYKEQFKTETCNMFIPTEDVIDACLGMSYEEIENSLALSILEHNEFNVKTIINRKRQTIRATGFMDFGNPEPIENLGGLDNLKAYIKKRKEAFESGSIKPKLKSILLIGVPGCLTGDTIINVCRKQRTGGYKSIRLDALYYRFNGKHKEAKEKGLLTNHNKKWDLSIDTKCHSYKEKEQFIGFNEIEGVIYSGIKEVYEVTTDFGFKIKATKDHKFLTEKGYITLGNLKKGDKVYTHKEGELVNGNKTGRKINIPPRQINNVGKHPNARKRIVNEMEYTSYPLHRLVVEAHMNKLKLEDFLYKLENDISNLRFLDPKLEIHHMDENRKNNTIKNLQVLTKDEHARIHAEKGKLNRYRYFPRFQKIISIKYIGKRKTYDIQMKAPDHNFVANGFIVHNSGKSLASKAIASIFNWPLITLDIGALKGSLVGDTERNTRVACKTIDACGKAIVQIEEIEKALSGSTGQNLDSGVSAGMLGYLLTWMQERDSESILIATANDISKLPPEFLRSGRWDCIFFVNTPNTLEIKEIIQIMNSKYGSKLPITSKFCNQLFEEQWTGAEIEQLAKDSHFDSIEIAMENIPLLAKFKSEEIKELREKARQFRAANAREPMASPKPLNLKVDSPKRKLFLNKGGKE